MLKCKWKNLNVYPMLFVYKILWLTITFTFSHPYVPTCASMSHWTPAQLFILVFVDKVSLKEHKLLSFQKCRVSTCSNSHKHLGSLCIYMIYKNQSQFLAVHSQIKSLGLLCTVAK